MSEKTKEDKFIDEMVESMQDYKKPRNYDADDVDARIKFYGKYIWDRELLIVEHGKVFDVFSNYFDSLKIDSKKEGYNIQYLKWLLVFCFGDMNEDFKEKISVLERK
jgi:hypothetical protein